MQININLSKRELEEYQEVIFQSKGRNKKDMTVQESLLLKISKQIVKYAKQKYGNDIVPEFKDIGDAQGVFM